MIVRKMRSSSKQGGASNAKAVNSHMNTLHQRLYNALNLGTRVYIERERRWQSADIEVQRHVVRAMAAFLDCFTRETSNNQLLKDSVSDMFGALLWILRCKNGAVLSTAANVVVKLINIIPNSMLLLHTLDLVRPLSSLLYFNQEEVATSSAIALNMILSSLNEKEKEPWEILKETRTVTCIVSNIHQFSSINMSLEFFLEMASLLSTILLRWPPSRYLIWNDTALMKLLEDNCANADLRVERVTLKLYYALALCGLGAKKILENGNTILNTMIKCMDESRPHSVRVEGFKLAQCLARDEQGCLEMMSMCCEFLVKAIAHGMTGSTLRSGKIMNDQMPLLLEACRLALITRWAGEHHIHFWKHGIQKVLVNLLLENFSSLTSECSLSLEEQISIAQNGLNSNYLLNLRPFVWDILGWLATHCQEDFTSCILEDEFHTNMLITCSCVAFLSSLRNWRHIRQADIADSSRSESASRAVLMLMYSPCKYFASKTSYILGEILKPSGENYVKMFLPFLDHTSAWDINAKPNILQAIICLVSLTCYLGLPQYWKLVWESKGTERLLFFLKWCLKNHVHIGRPSLSPHLQNIIDKRTCCCVCKEDWEDNDILLLYGLWALAELVHHIYSEGIDPDMFSQKESHAKSELFLTIQEISNNIYTPGPRWYVAYILSCVGCYGFQSRFGKKLIEALTDKELSDMQLILVNGDPVDVHRVVLALQCPSLLPPKDNTSKGIEFNRSSLENSGIKPQRVIQEVRLSTHVDHPVLLKLLEFIYSGYVEVEEELVKKLKTLAKHCNLRALLAMLQKRRPKWGSTIPSVDVALALGPAGNQFSDIILEAKETELRSSCCTCSLTIPHMHVHKIMLWLSCEYLRALFKSGMQESHSRTIKVPVSWEAMVKLVNWFYTDELPNPPSGCIWDNMDTDEKLYQLQPYLEIYWLADFWVLEDVQGGCATVIESCLSSARELCLKVLHLAANLSLWSMAEVAAEYMAPLYPTLRDSGALDELDETLVDMVRAASVRQSREGASNYCR